MDDGGQRALQVEVGLRQRQATAEDIHPPAQKAEAALRLNVGAGAAQGQGAAQFGIERAVSNYAEENGRYWGVLAIGTTFTLVIAGLVECLG